MKCSSCGEQTAEGKFCTNCGAELRQEELYESVVGSTASASSADQNPNETVEKLKTTGSNFGHFFVTLVKSPSEAKKANGSDMSSGIITFSLFSLLVALSYHLILSTIQMGFFMQISFLDSFILPFIIFTILYLLIAGLTFAGAKLSVQAVTFPDVIAKYGAYLVPFLLLFTSGILFWLIGLSALAGLILFISILGSLLIAPTFILMEQEPVGFDRIYVLIGLYIIILLISGLFIQSFMDSMLGSFLNSMFNSGF